MASQSGGSVVWDLNVDKSKFSAGLSDARGEVNKTAKDIDGSMGNIASSVKNAFNQATSASFAFAGALSAVGIAGLGAVGFGVKMAADIETARQGFVTLLGSAEAADEAIAQIKKDAAQTPFEFSGLVRANQMLTQVTKNAPRSESLLLNVGKALSAAGKSGAELDNVIVNLQQIANTSKISELDIRQFGFAGINILELLADQYGVTKDEAADMVKNSKDAFGDLEAAFAKAGGAGGKFERAFIDQAGTFNQLMSNFKDVVAQTAGDIVTQTGIFDAVKQAIGGIVDTLVRFQPQIVQGIQDFMAFMSANGPIVVGIIAGGLAPAFVALAGSIGAALIPLLPFVAAGAALGFVVQTLVDQLGGWTAVQNQLNGAMTQMGDMFNTLFKPSLDSLWQTIQTNLLPPLKELWTLLSPILMPALEILAKFMGAALYGAFIVIIEVLKLLITWVGTAIARFNDLITFFKGIPDAIRAAFSGLKDAITRPFEEAWGKIQEIAEKIKSKMQEISPFHRNSPSVVDLVTSGVGVIKDQFASLNDIKFPNFGHEMADNGGFMTAGFEQSKEPQTNNNYGGPVTVNIGAVNERSDVDMINRELGFRASLLPAT